MDVVLGEDGVVRCAWAATTPDYFAYHDSEWGFGATDEWRLFEKLCLEGFQSGLSWITILRKRDNFRAAFDDFDVAKIAAYGDADVERLLSDAGIVRHGGKIRSAINNARRTLELYEQFGSLAEFFWRFADLSDTAPDEIPAVTETSTAISKELKRLGFTFVGPTTMYAHMQAMGLVNDHVAACPARSEAQRARVAAAGRVGITS